MVFTHLNSEFSIRLFPFLDRVTTRLNKIMFVCVNVCMTKNIYERVLKKISGFMVAGCFSQRNRQQ